MPFSAGSEKEQISTKIVIGRPNLNFEVSPECDLDKHLMPQADKGNLNSYLDLTSCNLSEYSIHFQEIADAFGRLLDDQQTLQLELRTDLLGSHRFDLLVNNLLGRVHETPTHMPVPKERGMVVISSEPGNDEAIAAAGILGQKMRRTLLHLSDTILYCVEDYEANSSDVGRSVISARAVVILLSSGSLDSWLQLKVIIEAMAVIQAAQQICVPHDSEKTAGRDVASPLGNVRQNKLMMRQNKVAKYADVVPVIMPSFTFPDTEFYENRFYQVWKEKTEDAEVLVRSFFKRIGVSLDTWASDTVLEAQTKDIMLRIPEKFDDTITKEMNPFFSSPDIRRSRLAVSNLLEDFEKFPTDNISREQSRLWGDESTSAAAHVLRESLFDNVLVDL